jgi:hypothetical protein
MSTNFDRRRLSLQNEDRCQMPFEFPPLPSPAPTVSVIGLGECLRCGVPALIEMENAS